MSAADGKLIIIIHTLIKSQLYYYQNRHTAFAQCKVHFTLAPHRSLNSFSPSSSQSMQILRYAVFCDYWRKGYIMSRLQVLKYRGDYLIYPSTFLLYTTSRDQSHGLYDYSELQWSLHGEITVVDPDAIELRCMYACMQCLSFHLKVLHLYTDDGYYNQYDRVGLKIVLERHQLKLFWDKNCCKNKDKMHWQLSWDEKHTSMACLTLSSDQIMHIPCRLTIFTLSLPSALARGN